MNLRLELLDKFPNVGLSFPIRRETAVAKRFQSLYQLQLMVLAARVLCWEGFWVWKKCHELLVMSVMGKEGKEGSKLTNICQL